jgi:DNA-binding response OmpR family regulator
MNLHSVLIVDDDPNVLELLRVNCTAKGYTVFTAVNGAEAIKIVNERLPNLVILDVMMPEMDGLETCKLIRDKYQDAIKIIMLTAKDTARDKIIGINILKADEYLTKPFDIDDLLAKVEHLLESGRT